MKRLLVGLMGLALFVALQTAPAAAQSTIRIDMGGTASIFNTTNPVVWQTPVVSNWPQPYPYVYPYPGYPPYPYPAGPGYGGYSPYGPGYGYGQGHGYGRPGNCGTANGYPVLQNVQRPVQVWVLK